MPQPIDIRPYRVTDGPAVTALVAAAWPGDAVMQRLQATHGPDRDSPLRRAVVAEWDGELAGAACVTGSDHHPSRHTLVLHVDPRCRRRGVGSALLARMRAASAASGLPFRTRARPSDASSTAFLAGRGFRVLVRVRTGVIDPAEPAVQRRVEELAHPPPGTRLLPFGGAESTASVDDCVRVLGSVYADTHRWDRPAPWPAARAREHFCGPELVAGSMVCAYQDAALAGVGIILSLGDAAVPEAWYLSDVGVAGQDQPHARELTGALAAHCLEHAARNRRMVEFEVDDSHAHLWAVLETVPVVSASTDLVIMADDPTSD